MVIRITDTVSNIYEPYSGQLVRCKDDEEAEAKAKVFLQSLEEQVEISDYIEQIKDIGEEARNLYSIRSLLERRNSKQLVEYFLPDVVEIAERYHDESTSLNLMNLVSEGVIALTEHINHSSLRYTTIRTNVRDAIEKGIGNCLLAEEANRLTTEYNTNYLSTMGVDLIKTFQGVLDKEVADKELNDVLQTLTDREREIIKHRYGLGNYEPRTPEEVAPIFKVTPSRIRQIESKAISKLKQPIRSHQLDNVLDVYEWTRSRRFELREEPEDLETILQMIKRDLKVTPDEFMHHHKLSRNAFANFLTSVYPHLGKKVTLRLVSFSEEERNKLRFGKNIPLEEYKDIDSIKRTIVHLKQKKQELDRKTEIDLRDRLRELYFPLFISDKNRCIALLQDEANKTETLELKDLFLHAANYFSKVRDLTIEGVRTSLDDFQKVDVEILSTRPVHIIASEMGTGKSLEAIAYAMRKGLQNILIVSTKSGAFSTWPRELEKHLVSPNIVMLDRQTLKSETPSTSSNSERTWFITTYSTASKNIVQLKKNKFDLVILDESHKVNNHNTAQSRSLLSLDPSHKLAISGSLFKNYRIELFPILNWLYPTDFTDQDDFERTYCRDDDGLYRLQFELKKRMICRLKDEVLDLPCVKHSTESVAMESNILKEYTAMEEDFIRWYEEKIGSVNDSFASQAVITKLHKLRLKAIEPKIPLIDEIVKEAVDTREKTVLYTTYISAAENFTERYKEYGVCSLDGRTLNTERAKIIKQFEDDLEKRVFVVTAAGGESIDLTPARRIIYANKPLTYADEKQMLDRLNRRGQKNTVQAYHLVTLGSIDERIQRLIDRKKEEYDRVIHGSKEFVNWFEESESQNVRELIEGMVPSPSS